MFYVGCDWCFFFFFLFFGTKDKMSKGEIRWMQEKEFLAIVEERAVFMRCGFPCCPNALKEQLVYGSRVLFLVNLFYCLVLNS